MRIPATGTTIPRGVKRVIIDLEVAGIRHTGTVPALPNQTFEFTWNGQDAAGTMVSGPQRVNARISYVKRGSWPRPELTRVFERVSVVGVDDARRLGLGGWTLSPNHVLDRWRNRLYFGDGRRRRATVSAAGEELHVAVAGEICVFDQTGRHLKTLDARSGIPLFSFRYDAAGRLVSIEQNDGSITRIEHDVNSAVIVVPSGRRTTLALRANGYVTSVVDPAGQAARCTFDDSGLLRELVDANGGVFRFSYDAAGRIIRRDDGDGGFTSWASTRSEQGSSVAVITSLGRETIYQRDRLPTGERRRRITCCGNRVTEIQEAPDRTHTVTRPDGTIVRSRFEGDAELMEMITPSGLTRRMLRRVSREKGRITTQTELNGRRIVVTDDLERRERVVQTGERVDRISRFDAQGRLIEKRVAGRHPISFLHDDPDRSVIVRFGADPDVRVARFKRDEDGRLTEIVDPLDRSFHSQYDQAGFLVKQTLADASLVGFGCDAAGNRVAISPPGRPPHSFRRNARNLIAAFTAPGGERAAETTCAYDVEGRLVRVQRPDGTVLESRYDAIGQLAEIVQPRGVLRFSSDPRTGRRVALTSPDGSTVSYAWDGFLLTSLRWEGAVRGEVIREYDDEFRIRSFSVNGVSIEREYGPDGRCTRVGHMHIRRDEAGRVAETILGGVRTRQAFNGFGELESFAASFGDDEVYRITLRRDALGRVIEKNERVAGESHLLTYSYDKRRRLVAVERDGRPFAQYEYDANGNRVVMIHEQTTRHATFDSGDRVLRDGDTEFQHNRNGERIAAAGPAGVTRYAYDSFGNLLSVSRSDGREVEYHLDGDGRRLSRSAGGAVVQAFLYRDVVTPIAEVNAAGEITARFVFGERMNVPDYVIRGDSLYRVIVDHLGSPRLIVDSATGAIAQRIDYDPFGVIERDTSPGFQPFGLAGGIHDPDTHLLHFGTRDYDPQTGRWMTPDPARFGGRDTNLYTYVSNDPVNLLDPFGLFGIFPGEGPNWHHTRNAWNNCPETAPDQQNQDCPDQQGPPQLPPGWSYEGRPPTHGGHYRGFRHEAGYQCMYDEAGDLVTDPTMEGTYDYSPPYNPDGTVNPGGVVRHVIWDVIPWILWGN